MSEGLDQNALDTLFFNARSQNAWQDREVPDDLLRKLHDTLRMGPTSANSCPARFLFVKSDAAKEKLKPALMEGNVEKTMTAPVVAIIGYDLEFYEKLPQLFPHTDARSWFVGKPKFIESTAFRNGSLQGAYLIMAARALGLDCGPMSGFSNKKVDELFFEGTSIKSNFLCGLGYGDPEGLFGRSPRLSFEEACEIL